MLHPVRIVARCLFKLCGEGIVTTLSRKVDQDGNGSEG